MNALDQKVRGLVLLIKSAGGKAMIPEDAPAYVKRAFVQMIEDCPDCRKTLGLDKIKAARA